jgi:hypothetical protein
MHLKPLALCLLGLSSAFAAAPEQSARSRHADTTASQLATRDQLDQLLEMAGRVELLAARSDEQAARRTKIFADREKANTLANRLQVIAAVLHVLSITLLMLLFGMRRKS